MKYKFLVWFCFIILSSSTLSLIPGFCVPWLYDLEKSSNLANAQLLHVLTWPGEEKAIGMCKGLHSAQEHLSGLYYPPTPSVPLHSPFLPC